MALDNGLLALQDLLVAMRNSVTHDGGRQRKVVRAWTPLPEPERAWWIRAAGHPLPLGGPEDEFVLDDRHLLGILKALDRVALGVNALLRVMLDETQWACCVVAECRAITPAKALDSRRNLRVIARHAERWRLSLSDGSIEVAIGRTSNPALMAAVQPLRG